MYYVFILCIMYLYYVLYIMYLFPTLSLGAEGVAALEEEVRLVVREPWIILIMRIINIYIYIY